MTEQELATMRRDQTMVSLIFDKLADDHKKIISVLFTHNEDLIDKYTLDKNRFKNRLLRSVK